MNKKKFLNLIQEYQIIIDDREFNPNFYNEKRLNELKEIISRQLIIYKMRCPPLSELEYTYAAILQKIRAGESIEGYDYEKCYIEFYVGPLTLKQLKILMIIFTLLYLLIRFISYIS